MNLEPEAIPHGQEVALLCLDDPAWLAPLRDFFAGQGYYVLEEPDPKAAMLKLRMNPVAVAVTSRERNPGLPDVPSLRELGVPDYEVGGWYAIFGPPRMNAEWLQRLNEAARRALADEALKAKLIEQGYEIWSGAPSLVSERAARELALWSAVTKDLPAQ